MNVDAAAKVLSNSVATALRTFSPDSTWETAQFCDLLDQFFDCMNVRSTSSKQHSLKPFRKPYISVDDERFVWLEDTFLEYFNQWKINIDNRPGNFSQEDKQKMFISWQTWEGC